MSVTLPASSTWLVGAAMLAAGACSSSSSAELTVEEDENAVVTTLEWSYDDWSVDVEVRLSTAISLDTGSCETNGRVVVDKVTSFKDIAQLETTSCEQLMVTEDGDIIVLTEATAVSWVDEVLNVNKDDRRLRLGPITGSDEAEYSFVLESDPCSDDPLCDCAFLQRHRDDEQLELDLGRDCDGPFGS